MLSSNPDLKNQINLLWNKFWSNGISNPLTAIEQISYLLFMKRLDVLDSQNESSSQSKNYISKFEGYYIIPDTGIEVDKKTLRWSYFKNLPKDEILSHVQQNVFPFLKTLDNKESVFSYYMKDAVFLIPKSSLLIDSISIIEDIYSLIETDAKEGGQFFQDIQGDVYEYLLSEISTSGKNGQFRTPRHIIKLIAELVEPKHTDKIIDPSCGSGGFLLGAYQYIITQIDDGPLYEDIDGFHRRSGASISNDLRFNIGANLYGFDIDVTMVRLALMNLMMHGIESPHINYQDTLSRNFSMNNQFQIVMANPPFTGSIDKNDINENLTLNTTKTELLFLENILNLLENGGTAGVIIPQGVLFGSNKASISLKKILLEKSSLKAVICMPSGIFRPYAGVSTAIIIFTKGEETQNVWFYNMENDGYSLDDKRSKFENDSGDLQDIIVQYKNRFSSPSDRKNKHFFVSRTEIESENYDLSFNTYKSISIEKIDLDKPEVILEKINILEAEIIKDLDKFKRFI